MKKIIILFLFLLSLPTNGYSIEIHNNVGLSLFTKVNVRTKPSITLEKMGQLKKEEFVLEENEN